MTQEERRHRLASVGELKEKGWMTARVEGKDLILVQTDDGPKGYVNFCTHMGGKLRCRAGTFVCGMHGARFECRTGAALPGGEAPNGSKLEAIELVTEGDDLYYVHKPKPNPWALT